MRIRVCLPFYSEFEFARPGLIELKNSKEHEFVIEPRQGTYIWKIRNSLINDGQSCKIYQKPLNYDAFLLHDSDVLCTEKQVLEMIESKKDIVSLPYESQGHRGYFECGEFGQVSGNIRTRYPVEQKGFQKVGWAGAGMILILKHVFEKIQFPWFWHPMVTIKDCQDQAGEDIGFSMGANKAGFDIFCNFNNPVKHNLRNPEQFNWAI